MWWGRGVLLPVPRGIGLGEGPVDVRGEGLGEIDILLNPAGQPADVAILALGAAGAAAQATVTQRLGPAERRTRRAV